MEILSFVNSINDRNTMNIEVEIIKMKDRVVACECINIASCGTSISLICVVDCHRYIVLA